VTSTAKKRNGKSMVELQDFYSMGKAQTKNTMVRMLESHDYTILDGLGWIVARPEWNGVEWSSVALVSHIDAVSTTPLNSLEIKEENGVISLQPFSKARILGADDKNGLWSIAKVIEGGARPWVILTDMEERGCIGAQMLVDYVIGYGFNAHDIVTDMLDNVSTLVEIDRGMHEGKEHEAVFYTTQTEEFVKYVENHGYNIANGSYSDVATLVDMFDHAMNAVNLNAGYVHEHTNREYTVVKDVEYTVEQVIDMVYNSDKIPSPYEVAIVNKWDEEWTYTDKEWKWVGNYDND